MVKVGDGEDNAALGYGMEFIVYSFAELAFVAGAVQDGRADFGQPVSRVLGIVTGHIY